MRERSRQKQGNKSIDIFDSDDEDIQIQKEIVSDEISEDKQGYAVLRSGQMLGRWRVTQKLGRGVFGVVVKAVDGNGLQAAIKILRNNQTMARSGANQINILKSLSQPKQSRHVLKILQSFRHGPFLCIVYELLGPSLKQYSEKIKIRISVLADLARQIFNGLAHLEEAGVIHADLKPDNVLFDRAKQRLIISDFGSALRQNEAQIFDYLVARYYRAPQLVLGLPYNTKVDVWSTACLLFQIFTGQPLFPAGSSVQLLILQIKTVGGVTDKMKSLGKFSERYFLKDQILISRQQNGKIILHCQKVIKQQGRSLEKLLRLHRPDECAVLGKFRDFLERCLMFNPKGRFLASQALRHPFLKQTEELQGQSVTRIIDSLLSAPHM